jgi:hypothetical protein
MVVMQGHSFTVAIDPEFEDFCREQFARIDARLNPPKGRTHYSGRRRPNLHELDTQVNVQFYGGRPRRAALLIGETRRKRP